MNKGSLFLWFTFVAFLVGFVVYFVVTDEDLRLTLLQQPDSFRDLPRRTQILVGLGVWFALVIVTFAVFTRFQPDEGEWLWWMVFLGGVVVWLILTIVSYLIWKRFEPENGLGLGWLAFLILWPPAFIVIVFFTLGAMTKESPRRPR